ncbi:hypothetical protein Avbf_19187 [Armadillidium vulgare]|nr:hypothetical protein Avbf_19187 [Armadillidium vulgare]
MHFHLLLGTPNSDVNYLVFGKATFVGDIGFSALFTELEAFGDFGGDFITSHNMFTSSGSALRFP